jgi:hypothetical protein
MRPVTINDGLARLLRLSPASLAREFQILDGFQGWKNRQGFLEQFSHFVDQAGILFGHRFDQA